MPRFIVVTGTPGVGKSAFAKKLAEAIGATHVDLTRFARERKRLLRYDRRRKTSTVDMVGIARDLRRLPHRLTIVEGNYSHLLLRPGELDHTFVLRLHPGRLKRRLEARGYDRQKVNENLLCEVLDLCYAEAVNRLGKKVSQIDMTNKRMNEALGLALKALTRGRPVHQPVDWLKGFGRDRTVTKLLLGGRRWPRGS